MFKFLFKILFFLVIGILIYNYFWGNTNEKAQAKTVVSEVKEAGKAIGSLLKTEKAKFENGKYDKVLDKMSVMLQKMKSTSKSKATTDEINQLEKEKIQLDKKLKDISNQKTVNPQDKKDLMQRMEDLLSKAENVANKME